jgi:hypothetical protein
MRRSADTPLRCAGGLQKIDSIRPLTRRSLMASGHTGLID